MKSVFCTASSDQARRVVENLKAKGFSDAQVSLVLLENSTNSSTAEQPTYDGSVGTTTAVGTVAGAGAGAALGWAATSGAASVLGPLVAAGPVIAILGGIAAGGTTGGALGAMLGTLFPEKRAKHYADRIHAGDVIVVAHPHGGEEEATVHAVYALHGVSEIDEAMLKLDKAS